MGPALQHFRAFRVWVPENSAMRISATIIWWFFPSFVTDDNLLTLQDLAISYPPTRDRPHPQPNGADLLGRYFLEPELGVCAITAQAWLSTTKENGFSGAKNDTTCE